MDRVDTKFLTKKLFETCDGVSPNIRLCYRVLKFIHDYFKTAENYQMQRLVDYTMYIHSIYPTKSYLENLSISFTLALKELLHHFKNSSDVKNVIEGFSNGRFF